MTWIRRTPALESTLKLLRPYKAKYLKEAQSVRSSVSFAYLHGGASLLDFLDAQKSYRDTELNYLNLVGAYFSAANQLNFAVGSRGCSMREQLLRQIAR